jgi:hypothetical protein
MMLRAGNLILLRFVLIEGKAVPGPAIHRDALSVDLQPGATTQVVSRPDILNVGGFSDKVFDIVGMFLEGVLGGEHLVTKIRGK